MKKYETLSDRKIREFLSKGGQFMAPVYKHSVAGSSGQVIRWEENQTPIRIGSDGEYPEDDD